MNPYNGYIIKTVDGKEINKPCIIGNEGIETIIVPEQPRVYEDILRQCKTEFPNVRKIIHIVELL
jgi:hypothetical protein